MAISFLAKAIVFDLDGVLFRGETAVSGAADALSTLRAQGRKLFFLTNNSTATRDAYVKKLAGFSIEAHASEIVTSASATASYLLVRGDLLGETLFVVGGIGLVAELRDAGFAVRTAVDPESGDSECAAVVVGLDRGFNYDTLRRAQQILLRDTAFIATNRDGQYPVETGVVPGAGSVVAALAAASDREPVTIGKPDPLGLRMLLQLANVAPADALMVGDRLDTDIACASRANVPSCLVLTGVTTLEQAAAATGERKPDFILDSVAELGR